MRNRYGFIFIMIFLTVPDAGLAQIDPDAGLAEKLEAIAEENAVGYMQPFATALGTAINSGIYHTAKVHGLGGFDIGIRVMAVSIPDTGKIYSAFNGFNSFNVPTLFGNKTSDEPLLHVGGLDIGTLIFAVPQISIGLFMGTELNIRYLPPIEFDESIGEITFIGYGLSHNLNQWIPVPLPLAPKLTIGFMFQEFEIGEIIKSSHTAFNIRVSKGVPLLSVYAGAQIESSDLDITYQSEITGSEIVLPTLDGDNDIRFTGGFRLTLFPFIGINVDYSAGEYNAVNIGLSFSFDPPGIPVI